jgi:hypothetical protein
MASWIMRYPSNITVDPPLANQERPEGSRFLFIYLSRVPLSAAGLGHDPLIF